MLGSVPTLEEKISSTVEALPVFSLSNGLVHDQATVLRLGRLHQSPMVRKLVSKIRATSKRDKAFPCKYDCTASIATRGGMVLYQLGFSCSRTFASY